MDMRQIKGRRAAAAVLALLAVSGIGAEAMAQTTRDVSRDLHERRAIERRSLQRQSQEQIRPQESRPVPPRSPNSQVVPNR